VDKGADGTPIINGTEIRAKINSLLFRLTGAFAQFERSMIRQRVRAGLSVIKVKLERDGKFVSEASKVRRRLGRPGARTNKIDLARCELSKGFGIGKVAREVGRPGRRHRAPPKAGDCGAAVGRFRDPAGRAALPRRRFRITNII
jgi:hypothetical protein